MGNYWFESGTPVFLVKLIKEGKWQLRDLAPVTIDAEYLASVGLLSKDVVPVLYQTGYLTIKSYDKEYQEFLLDYPNEEVKNSFLKYLLKNYVAEVSCRHGLSIQDFAKEIRQGEPDKFMKRFEALLAGMGYAEKGTAESRFQDAMYLVFTLLGSYAKVEERTSDGRIDLKVETDKFIYLFEFKMNSRASVAMAQLLDKEYWLPYRESGKQIFLIGVSCDSRSRKISEYEIERLPKK